MGGGVFYHIFSSAALVSLALYHLVSATTTYLKSPLAYVAKPYHPVSSSHRFKYLQLYLLITCLLIAFAHQTLISSDSDPLLKGSTPVHRFTSLQSAAVLFLFLILSLSLLISDATSLLPLPSDLFFALASATSDLQAKCDSVSAQISALAALLCLILACQPRMFVADVGLGGAVCLQGLWMLQTGLSLYVDAFIPDGCHKLLDVVSGVEGSTKCELEDSRLRAVAILDLVFVVHAMFVVLIVMVTYGGSYEALPIAASSPAESSSNHIQMKALTGTQA
ncbi:protein CbbY [Salix suchowensis]|nr:protein CbbY [Salix suchowensis]